MEECVAGTKGLVQVASGAKVSELESGDQFK